MSFDRYGAMVIVNGKTGMRRVRLIFAMPYLSQWLESHPLREKKDAPLWIISSGAGSQSQGMNYSALRQQIRRIAGRAGVSCKVNPHNFRHFDRITTERISRFGPGIKDGFGLCSPVWSRPR